MGSVSEQQVVERGGVQLAVRAARVLRDRAHEAPPKRAVERLRRVALPRVEHQRAAPSTARLVLGGQHQGAPDAAPARARVDHQLDQLGPVAAVGAPLEIELYGAGDRTVLAGHPYKAPAPLAPAP